MIRKTKEMVMLYLPPIIVAVSIFIMPLSEASAWHDKRPVTPYGDYCPRCTDYGTCKSQLGHDDARKAMFDYYHKKGLTVEIMRKRGRFIKAKIKEKGEVVDVIIFDRRTGRVRSIY